MLGTAGAGIVGAGLSTLSPGFKDAILAFLNQRLGLEFLDLPLWLACILVLFGAALLLLAFFGPARVARALAHIAGTTRPRGAVVAIKEIGFAPAVRNLNREELPLRLAGREVQHLVVDVAQELSANPPHLEAALAKQLRLPDQVAALRSAQPGAELAFCGIVQAPFSCSPGTSSRRGSRRRRSSGTGTLTGGRHSKRGTGRIFRQRPGYKL